MNRRIKKMAYVITAIITFSEVQPLINFDFLMTAAYASSYSLSDIKLETSGGSDIDLYENDNYTKKLDNSKSIKDTYYAKLSSDRSKIIFRTSGSDGIIKIFKDHSSKVYDDGDSIPVLTGKTTFRVRSYSSYDPENSNDYKDEYRIIIKRYTSEEEQEIRDDDQGNIYLQKLELDYGDIPIGFDRKKPNYNAKVDYDVKSISIKAEPEDGATTVKINNITVDENDDYKKMVSLNKGDNVIKISLSQDEEEERIYTINITRLESVGETSEAANNNGANTANDNGDKIENNNSSENNVTDTRNPNKWVKVSDKWRYNDSFGNPIKNTWYYDNNNRKNYYFNNDGDMVTGWINLNNSWYYLSNDGAMETGWKMIGGKWYYLNYNGKMQTGWFKDIDGKYYYLDQWTGAMVHDTTINGYKLGSNGVWKK